MWLNIVISLLIIQRCTSISSPIQPLSNLTHSRELENNVADLWWSVDDNKREITFELHVKTTGWIALGISPSGGMKGADIGVGWVDQDGSIHFQDRYAFDIGRPMVDNTTSDWIALQGKESNGWTAIQFKRLLDTCDPMDYPIKGGTNTLIYAYGLVDPENFEISYHANRRGTRAIPLLSYGQPPTEDKFRNLEYFDLRLNNYVVPPNDTTYHCKIYKAPANYTTKRHAIAYKVLVDDKNVDLVHHLLLHECNPSAVFDDNNLPDGVCDEIFQETEPCSTSITTGWAVGGDYIFEFADEAGYPVGANSPNKYFMIQMHYDNPKETPNRLDSSGIRFYVSNELRQYDLGYLTFGTVSNHRGLAIPPKVDRFIVDSYCPSFATKNIPQSGITVFAAFPHTHLQGISVSTKIIRNKTAIEYLFNADSFQFNYQFGNRLAKTIQLYPGDEFATRCIYNTMNKNETTTGGEKTREEMCLHFFTYYPRMENFTTCYTMNTPESLQNQINSSSAFDYQQEKEWLMQRKWTPELAQQWQQYYNDGPKLSLYTDGGQFKAQYLETLPKYKDLEPVPCEKQITAATGTTATSTITMRNNAKIIHENPFLIFFFFFIISIFVV